MSPVDWMLMRPDYYPGYPGYGVGSADNTAAVQAPAHIHTIGLPPYHNAINPNANITNVATTPMPDWNALGMIAMRLKVGNGQRLPFDFINVHQAPNQTFIFVVAGGQAVTLTDDPPMFPSDALITQLRMIMNAPQAETEALALQAQAVPSHSHTPLRKPPTTTPGTKK